MAGVNDNLIPPKKGEVRNPNGRPKGSLNSKTILNRFLALEEQIENPVTGELENMTQLDIIYLKQIAKARKGDLQAMKEILDRFEGKATQSVEMDIKSDPRKEILDKYGLGEDDAGQASQTQG
jgi:hypothetical protein